MHALREEIPVEDDLHELRTSIDQKLERFDAKLERLDAKLDAGFQRQDVKLAGMLQQLGARVTAQDERFERQDAKQVMLLGKLDARFERQDERFERRDAKIEARFERMEAKIDRGFEALSSRRFAAWLAVLTSAATIAAAVLAFVLGGSHGH